MAENCKSLTEDAVAKFLQGNPMFCRDWFVQNGTKEMFDAWLMTKSDIFGLNRPNLIRSETDLADKYMMSHHGALIASNKFHLLLENRQHPRKNKDKLKELEEKELLMELIRDVASELDINILCHKILQNVSLLTNSDRGSLFLTAGSKEHKVLEAKLFDVMTGSTVEDSLIPEGKGITVPFGKGIAGAVAQTKEVINIKNAYEDPRFNKEVDKQTGFRTHSILCMPVCNYEGEVIGVAQIINKQSGNHEFTDHDVQVFKNYLTFCGIGIQNAQLFDMSVQEYKRNQLLLQLAKGIFEEQTDLDKLITKIMREAIGLLKCQRCCVYLIDDTIEKSDTSIFLESFTHLSHKDIDYQAFTNSLPDVVYETQQRRVTKQFSQDQPVFVRQSSIAKKNAFKEISFSKAFELLAKHPDDLIFPSAEKLKSSYHAQIARHVAGTGEVLNIEDAENHDKFQLTGEEEEGDFQTKNVLCMPIFDSENIIIGVAQLINKINGQPFTDQDANIFEAFAIFCGLGIHNTQMYENATKLMAKQSVALEVLSYHATAQENEAEKLITATIPPAEEFALLKFEFSDFPLNEDETCQACVRMFLECNIMAKFHVPYEVLCRWILSVKKNYRPVTYHNWRHAFNVTQTMFAMLNIFHETDNKTGEPAILFTDLEIFALLVACLCHDLDHRGTNNAFQTKTESPLSTLYGTSTMEHHHFDHCIMILNSDGNNIFQALSPEDYRKVIKMLEHAILSTDLALYFKKKGSFVSMVEQGETKFHDENKKELLRGMMMTACDVSAITKPWEVQKKVAELVASEFFEQGDIEKNVLHEQPIAMMDREKRDELPKMQVGFIDAICIPVYKMFATIEDKLCPLYDGLKSNRKNWQALALEEERRYRNANSLELERENSPLAASPNKREAQKKPTQKQSTLTEPKPPDPGPNAPTPEPPIHGEDGTHNSATYERQQGNLQPPPINQQLTTEPQSVAAVSVKSNDEKGSVENGTTPKELARNKTPPTGKTEGSSLALVKEVKSTSATNSNNDGKNKDTLNELPGAENDEVGRKSRAKQKPESPRGNKYKEDGTNADINQKTSAKIKSRLCTVL